jgi:hypothetical protein
MSMLLRLYFDITSNSLRSHFDLTSVSPRVHFEFTSSSIQCHLEITSISLLFHFDFASCSPRFPFDFKSVPLRFHFGLTLPHGKGGKLLGDKRKGKGNQTTRKCDTRRFRSWTHPPGSDIYICICTCMYVRWAYMGYGPQALFLGGTYGYR